MIDSVLCEGQVWMVGTNKVTDIVAYPHKNSGNIGCVRWLEVKSDYEILARLNPEYCAYIIYRRKGN